MKPLMLSIAAGMFAIVASACSSTPRVVADPVMQPSIADLGYQGMQPASGGEAEQLVVFFHGYTQQGAAMRPLAEALSERLPSAAFVFNNGPLREGPGFSWYNFRGDDSAATKEAARAGAAELVSNLSNRLHIPPSQIVTVGFSQGGGVAAQAGTCTMPGAAAVVSLAGVIETVCSKTEGVSPDVLIVWNEGDPTVNRDRINVGIAALKAAGFEPALDFVAGETHWPSEAGIQHALDFIVMQLGG